MATKTATIDCVIHTAEIGKIDSVNDVIFGLMTGVISKSASLPYGSGVGSIIETIEYDDTVLNTTELATVLALVGFVILSVTVV